MEHSTVDYNEVAGEKKAKAYFGKRGKKRSSLFLTELIILSEGVRAAERGEEGEELAMGYIERLDICEEFNSSDPFLNYSTRTIFFSVP